MRCSYRRHLDVLADQVGSPCEDTACCTPSERVGPSECDYGRGAMSAETSGRTVPHELAERTDFFAAWATVESADGYPATTRARAFALWVGLFQILDEDRVVTATAEEIAVMFSVSRAGWLQYRKLLSEVGLIEQHRSNTQHRPTIIRVNPPLRVDVSNS